ncbi:hypothetical protein HYW40_01710 [Candidatus Curtissbacteria bacterium]|nr:hypothetical protein [Candidatus Curtissbacteria bacterium]
MSGLKLALIVASIVLLPGCSITQKGDSTPGAVTAPAAQQEKVDFQASFEIYTDGLKRNFTSPKYHNNSEDVFISAENPSIVNVKRADITWGDFFNTLPMKLTTDCLTTGDGEVLCNNQTKSLKFFINEIETPNFLNEKIKSGDKAQIIYGN